MRRTGPVTAIITLKPEDDSDRPELTALTVARSRPHLIVVPALVLLVIGIVIGVARTPTYTATDSAALQITTTEPSALGGVTEATPVEAATFSRAATADAVVQQIKTATGVSKAQVTASVSASPVPQSGNMELRATAKTEPEAVRLVNALASALARFVATHSAPDARSVLQEYVLATEDVNRLKADQSPQAAAELQAALLRSASLQRQYQALVAAPSRRLVIFTDATTASGDRSAMTALLAVLGLLAGLSLGMLLCAWRARKTNLSSRRVKSGV